MNHRPFERPVDYGHLQDEFGRLLKLLARRLAEAEAARAQMLEVHHQMLEAYCSACADGVRLPCPPGSNGRGKTVKGNRFNDRF